MLVPNRHYSSPEYRYGFQGQEKDDEVKGEGNSINYKFRMHDPRIGRFFAVDPLTKEYSHYTPYSFSGNKVIAYRELEGLEELKANIYLWTRTGKVKLSFGIVSNNGNWSGTRYTDTYFFKKENGAYKYYEGGGEYGDGRTSWQNMQRDNPIHFAAMHMYWDFQERKAHRILGNVSMIVGGIITFGASFEAAPVYAAFAGTTGVYSVGIGFGKMMANIEGDFSKADDLPSSPLGGIGKAIDDSLGNKDHFYQDSFDIATSIIFLRKAGKLENWSEIGNPKRLNTIVRTTEAFYNYFKKHFSEDLKDKTAERVNEIIIEYDKIIDEINEKK